MLDQLPPKTILKAKVIDRAILYARVSTDEQAETGTSLENQVEKSIAYAKANDMQVVKVFREDYTGKVLDRPELNEVMAMLRAGQADTLIVYKPNRLDRSEWGVNLLILMRELKMLGVELHYSQDGRQVDLFNPLEALMYGSFAGWQAGEDHRETVRKLREGRYQRAKSGFVVPGGHQAPYGYKKVFNTDKKRWFFEIEPREANTVKLIYNWYVIGDESGKPLAASAIAEKLNDMGIPTRYNKGRTRVGAIWWETVVMSILKNETYAGTWHYGKRGRKEGKRPVNPKRNWVAVSVPPIIDRTLWELAQKRRQKRAKATNNKKYPYLLSGHLICGECGRAMSGCNSAKNGGYYVCPTRLNPEFRKQGQACKTPYFRVDETEPAVWNWLVEYISDKEAMRKSRAHFIEQNKQANDPTRHQLELVSAELAAKEQEFTEMYDSFKYAKSPRAKASLGVDMELLENQIDGLEKRKAKFEATLLENETTETETLTLLDFFKLIKDDIATISADFESRRLLLDRLNISVTLYLDEAGRYMAKISGVIIPNQEAVLVKKLPICRVSDRMAQLILDFGLAASPEQF